MQKFFVNQNQIDIQTGTIIIEGEDVNHIKNVLRYEIKDKIEICEKSPAPTKYICEIIKLDQKQVICKILNKLQGSNEPNIKIHIFQGLPKAEKMELIIQKCTELGVYEFVPVEMKRCVVKLNDKDMNKKVARWQKIAEVAAKQCGRDIVPNIREKINIKELVSEINSYDIVFVAYENENTTFLKKELQSINNYNLKIGIVIGPEGGFEEDEIEILNKFGAKIISLGNRILRTETVAMVMSGIIMYELGDIGG